MHPITVSFLLAHCDPMAASKKREVGSLMMTLSESLGQKCHPVSHAAPLKRNTPTPGELVPCHTKSSLGGSWKRGRRGNCDA